MTWPRAGRSGFRLEAGTKTSRLALRPAHPTQKVLEYSAQGVKQKVHQTNDSTPPSQADNNEQTSTSTPNVWLRSVGGKNFNFSFTFMRFSFSQNI